MTLPEWTDARTAALYLKPCTPKYLNEEVGFYLARQSANRPGTRTARSGGWLYHRHDLERVRAIMDALGMRAALAARMLASLRELERRDLLAYLLTQFQQSSEPQKRKFQ